jgi:glycosyltransferase involved in cell wall biosynthesis
LHGLPPLSTSLRHWLASSVGVPNRTGSIWAVGMARDEQVRLPGTLRHLVHQGVDHVVVADNLSSDHTADTVAELAMDLPITLVRDEERGYYQARKISRLARAASRRGAAWIVPFDADELWYGAGETIADVLRRGRGDILPAPVFDHLPAADAPDAIDPYVEIVRRRTEPVTNKVAFRAHLLAAVHQGNHWVNVPGVVHRGLLEIRHFPYLGFNHLRQKVALNADSIAHTSEDVVESWHIAAWTRLDDAALKRAVDIDIPMVTDPAPLGPGAVGTITVTATGRGFSRAP